MMIAPKTFESRKYPMPDIPPTLACCGWKPLASVAVTCTRRPVCGGTAHILGHEIAGCIAKLGSQAAHKWPFKEGDRVTLEEYMPCGVCEVCRKGVNVAVNVTGGGKTTVTDSIAVAAKQRCTIVLAAAGQQEINVGSLGRAKNVLKRAHGHSYFAVE
jgi:hypothetical protein